MNENQQTIGEWIDATFPGTDPDSPRKAIRALEECVELCLASGAPPQAVYEAVAKAVKESTTPWLATPEKIPVEAADTLIVLYGVAHMRGFDLHVEVDRKMAVNRARQWRALGDGTGYHVKIP